MSVYSSVLVGQETYTTQTPMQTLIHDTSPHIVINNRPLARVNGKTFSLIDVVKKMDIFIQTQYPALMKDKATLFQFYQNNWKTQLEQMIENELVLLDAESKEIDVSDGDIRKEMSERFSPNVFARLDEFNLSFEEARELVKNDLIIQQMLWYRAYSKARQSITPDTIKKSYDMHVQNFNGADAWKYEVLTLRGEEGTSEKFSAMAYDLLTNKQLPLKEVASRLNQEAKTMDVNVIASASSDYQLDSNQISKQHLDILSTLQLNGYSEPVKQTTRDGSPVHRIFHLKNHEKSEPEAFESYANTKLDQMLNQAAAREKQRYVDRLKKQFHFDENEQIFDLPQNYQPFALVQ